MTAGVHIIEVDAGMNELVVLTLTDETDKQINVASYAANFSVWPTANANGAPLFSLTNAAGITLGNAAANLGDINIALNGTITAQTNVAISGGQPINIDGKLGRECYYTLSLNNAGNKFRPLQGPFRVWSPVTT